MPEITNKFIQISSMSDREETSNSVQRSTFSTMNHLPEPISINNIDSTQNRSIDNDGYEAISDSDQNNSKDDFDDAQSKNGTRIVYSRDQLVNIFKLNYSNVCPDWIVNNQNFPRRLETKADEEYLQKLIEHGFQTEIWQWIDGWLERIKRKKVENEEDSNRIKSLQPQFKSKNPTNEFESNNGRSTRPMFNPENKNSYNPNNNSYNPNFRSNMNKFGERPQMFNANHYNQDRNRTAMMNENRNDDRNDGRGFLRSRGENLNQNFASFRRFPPNRNQNQDRGGFSNKPEQPEWFTEGPISQHDTIELKGFDEDEDKLSTSKNTQHSNSTTSKQQHLDKNPLNQQTAQQQKKKFDLNELADFDFLNAGQDAFKDSVVSIGNSSRFSNKNMQHSNSIALTQQQQNLDKNLLNQQTAQQLKKKFDLTELANFDFLNAGEDEYKDPVSIENSSRFARWFNGQQLQQPQAPENQIEKLFSNARVLNHPTNQQQFNSSQINPPLINPQQQINQQQFNQNDFMGNLMNRNQLPGLNSCIQKLDNLLAANNNNNNINNNYQSKSETEHSLLNSPKKTDQQLFNILQKARINMDSLMEQQQYDNKIIKGHVKSAEELEASLLNNQENNVSSSINQQRFGHQQTPHFNKVDLFQKLCLNTNRSELINKAPTQNREDNSAINPFVLNLLDDAQKLKNTNANKNMNNRSNFPQANKMFNSNNMGNPDKVNPFTPTSVIRKIAAKEKNNQMNKNLSEINFETVTGNHVNERSILNRIDLNENETRTNQDNFTILNQNTMMQQNFAIATSNRWNENVNYNLQQPRIDSTTSPEHQQDQRVLDADTLMNILIKATKKQNPTPVLTNNNLVNSQNNLSQRAPQNDNQKKLIEILQKASINNLSKKPVDTSNKINNWFELELKRNNDHLSPIIKENAFTLEDIERS